MQKQIIYCSFIPRLFALCIDLALISIVVSPIMGVISQKLFVFLFNDFFISQSINLSDNNAIFTASRTAEFVNHVTAAQLLGYFGTLFGINTFLTGIYFVLFWKKFNATPGKMFLRMKIVDADSFSAPSTYNLIKRFCGYFTAIVGIWSILFSARKMALHDKIANTVVIKS